MSVAILKFGTSGLRGPVTSFKKEDCLAYAMSFGRLLREHFPACKVISFAGDLRESTPVITDFFMAALQSQGFQIENLGTIPTPALAHWALQKSQASVMVTGSHIPADQNGVKFYTPLGEITKDDEIFISNAYQDLKTQKFDQDLDLVVEKPNFLEGQAEQFYLDRYLKYFGSQALHGLRIAFYEHSGVGRKILPQIFRSLGAEVVVFGRAAEFVPVDTENVTNVLHLQNQLGEIGCDILFSTDGDADRPLVIDSKYGLVRGDVLGIITSQFLDIKQIATPVSSTSLIEEINYFETIERTKIGSPFVIEAMEKKLKSLKSSFAGFEANGGFLLGARLENSMGGAIEALLTRDCTLPMVAFAVSKVRERLDPLFEKFGSKTNLSGLVPHFPKEVSTQLMQILKNSPIEVLGGDPILEGQFADPQNLDLLDGVKLVSREMETIHFRPSGNAPEFRIYVEANTKAQAIDYLQRAENLCRKFLESRKV